MTQSSVFPSSSRRAFTLIELLVVVAIIGVLAAIAVPVFSRVRESSNTVKCASNLRQLGAAVFLYANEHDGYPPSANAGNGERYEWFRALQPYLTGDKGGWDAKGNPVLYCPSRKVAPDRQSAGSSSWSQYTVNPFVMVDAGYSSAQPIKLVMAQRASTTFMLTDGTQSANGYVSPVPWAQPNIYDDRPASDPLPIANDKDPTDQAMIRYRHSGDAANFLFMDGHVEKIARGKLLYRNVRPNSE